MNGTTPPSTGHCRPAPIPAGQRWVTRRPNTRRCRMVSAATVTVDHTSITHAPVANVRAAPARLPPGTAANAPGWSQTRLDGTIHHSTARRSRQLWPSPTSGAWAHQDRTGESIRSAPHGRCRRYRVDYLDAGGHPRSPTSHDGVAADPFDLNCCTGTAAEVNTDPTGSRLTFPEYAARWQAARQFTCEVKPAGASPANAPHHLNPAFPGPIRRSPRRTSWSGSPTGSPPAAAWHRRR